MYKRQNIYSTLGKYQEAYEDFNKVVGLNPNSVLGYLCRGVMLQTLGRFEEALSDYNKVLSLDPEDKAGFSEKTKELIKSLEELEEG